MPRLLIVDPDPILSRTLELHFQNDYEVCLAADAQSAIINADSAKPDLVVLELAMSRHNGIAFLQEFRSYTDWSEIPIVIYSLIPAIDTGLSELEWQKQRVMAYLYKSTTSLAALTQCIRNSLNIDEAL